MSDVDDYTPDPEANRAMIAEFKDNMRLSAERAEHNPWIHECRRVRAEFERTGNESLWVDFERRFLQAQALLYARVRKRGGALN